MPKRKPIGSYLKPSFFLDLLWLFKNKWTRFISLIWSLIISKKAGALSIIQEKRTNLLPNVLRSFEIY